MPVSRSSLEPYRGTEEERIVRFLAAHPNDGFTAVEVGVGIGLLPRERSTPVTGLDQLEAFVFVWTLGELKRQTRIDSAEKDGKTYYFSRQQPGQ